MATSTNSPAAEAFVRNVFAERQSQDEQWGGAEHDQNHTYEDWAFIFRKHATKLDDAMRFDYEGISRFPREGASQVQRRLVILAALCCALYEVIETEGMRG